MTKALKLTDVSLHINNDLVFSELNLEVQRGEIVSVCAAPSGNLRAFSELLCGNGKKLGSVHGSIMIDTAETSRLSEKDMRFLRMVNIGVLPPVSSVGSLNLTVQSYITIPFREKIKKSEREIILDAKRIMGLLGVKDVEAILRKKMTQLDRHSLCAVIYAAALSTDPAMAICSPDEDIPIENVEFMSLLIKICKIKNIALILLTNNIRFSKEYGEKVYILDEDKLYLPDEADENLLSFLSNASLSEPVQKPEKENREIIRVSHMKATRKDKKLHFSLFHKEIVSLDCNWGSKIFSGLKKPFHGSIYTKGTVIHRSKNFKSEVFHVSESFPCFSEKNNAFNINAFAKKNRSKEDLNLLVSSLSLSKNYLSRKICEDSLFDMLYMGLMCAAANESPFIILSDIDKLGSGVEKYELIMLLIKICEKTSAGAIVFSKDETIHKLLSSKLYGYENDDYKEKERAISYADAT